MFFYTFAPKLEKKSRQMASIIEKEEDIYGIALMDYFEANDPQDIIVHGDVVEDDIYETSHFFRNPSAFPTLERIALKHCKGKVLDIGAGTGVHTIYLKESGFDVYPIDISPLCVLIMQKQGLHRARKLDFYALGNEKYDTLLMLMNGFGIMGTRDKVSDFFTKAKEHLYPGGQIICDSSDLVYLFDDETRENLEHYYGEIVYQMEYKGKLGKPFKWLFLDFESMKQEAEKAGFSAEKIYEDDHYHFLAKLVLNE